MAGGGHSGGQGAQGSSKEERGKRSVSVEDLKHLSPDERIRRLKELEERKRRELEEEKRRTEKEIAAAHELIKESEQELEHLEDLEEEESRSRLRRGEHAAREEEDALEDIVSSARAPVDELSRPYRTGTEGGYQFRPEGLDYTVGRGGGRREPGMSPLYEVRGNGALPPGEDERIYAARLQPQPAEPGVYRTTAAPGQKISDSSISTNILDQLGFYHK